MCGVLNNDLCVQLGCRANSFLVTSSKPMLRQSGVSGSWNLENGTTNGQRSSTIPQQAPGRNCYEEVANIIATCYEDVKDKLRTYYEEFNEETALVEFNLISASAELLVLLWAPPGFFAGGAKIEWSCGERQRSEVEAPHRAYPHP